MCQNRLSGDRATGTKPASGAAAAVDGSRYPISAAAAVAEGESVGWSCSDAIPSPARQERQALPGHGSRSLPKSLSAAVVLQGTGEAEGTFRAGSRAATGLSWQEQAACAQQAVGPDHNLEPSTNSAFYRELLYRCRVLRRHCPLQPLAVKVLA